MARKIEFKKMHGLGNDFVILDARAQDITLSDADMRHICDRHFGVGCDQLVLLQSAQDNMADLRVRFYNGDGSQSGACGNATRCVASLLLSEKAATSCTLQTGGGLLHTTRAPNDMITVNMGAPRLSWQEIPLSHEVDTLALPLDGAPTAVNMGNPHCVIFVDNFVEEEFITNGKLYENNSLFPQRTNVEFVEKLGNNHFRQRTWERGAGITLACGSGACAVAVAAIRKGLAQKSQPITITLDGGDLIIEWRESDNNVYMTGPVAHIFDGTLHLD